MTKKKDVTRSRSNSLVSRSVKLIIQALRDASLWQESIADAHHYSLNSWDRTPENTRVAKRAIKLSRRYAKLHDELKASNAEVSLDGAKL